MEKSKIREKLLLLEKEVLVEALLEASYRDDITTSVIHRLVSKESENLIRFKSRLKSLSDRNYFISWREVSYFADELADMLDNLRAAATSPKEGLELLKLFFSYDQIIIEMCDDSSGFVGDVFRYNASEMFEEYATQCADKDYLADLLLSLVLDNEYGLRDMLADQADKFLPEGKLRDMFDQLWQRCHELDNKLYSYSNEMILLQKIASLLYDPILYEKALSLEDNSNEDYKNFRLGKMYFKAKDYQKSKSYLEKVDKKASPYLSELSELLSELYTQLGDIESVKKIAWERFRKSRSVTFFYKVLELEGKERESELLSDELSLIHKDQTLSMHNAEFLLEMKLYEDLESYLFQRKHLLNGDSYYSLLDLAEVLEDKQYVLTASLIYRALLDSILRRGYSKAYHHGVRYLKKLDKLANRIQDWKGCQEQEDYFYEVKTHHGRKHSFWAKYNPKGN